MPGPIRQSCLGVVFALALVTPVTVCGEPLILNHYTLRDPGSRNMESHTILAPKGWTIQGGAFWANPKLFRVHPSQHVIVSGPDGRFVKINPMFAATDIYPSPQMLQAGIRRPAEGAIDGCMLVVHIPTSLQEWGAWVKKYGIETVFPDATDIRMESVQVEPGLTQAVHHNMQPLLRKQAIENQQAAQLGSQNRAFADGAGYVALATYVSNGTKWEQMWVWSVVVVGTQETVGRQIWWTIEPNVSFRAPQGELKDDMPLLMTIANSLRMPPQWARMRANHIAKLEKIDLEAFVERSERHAQFSNEMQQILDKTWASQQESRDKGHEYFMKGMKEIKDFKVPGSKEPPIQVPIHFNHIWKSDKGSLYLAKNALDDPRPGSNETWKKMEPAKGD